MKELLAALRVPADRMRSADAAKVSSLAQSMAEIGQLQPILVRTLPAHATAEEVADREQNGVPILAGVHRYLAAKELGWEEIEVIELDVDDIDAELIEIDENLMRAELTASQRAKHVARRLELWAAREVSEPSVPKVGRPEGFASDLAKKTGMTKQAVNRQLRRAKNVAPAVLKGIEGTELDKGTTLDELARLKTREEQEAKVEEIRAAKAAPKPPPPPPAPVIVSHLAMVRAAIARGDYTREEFFDEL